MTPIIIPENEQLLELLGQEPALHLEPMLEKDTELMPFILFDDTQTKIAGILFV